MSSGLRAYSNPVSPDFDHPKTGYTIYQGSGRHKRTADKNGKVNMTSQDENGWYSLYTPGDREKKGANSTSGHPSSSIGEDDVGYEATMGDGPMPGKESGSPTRGIAHLFNVYSDKSSISGVPFIRNTKYSTVQIMWSCLLGVAIVAMGLHLYMLFDTFFDYGTQSKLGLNFSYLQFPAITICNANAVRLSKLSLASEDLQDLVESVKPEHLRELIKDWEPSYEDVDDNSEVSVLGKNRKKRSTNSSSQITVKHRVGSFFDDISTNSSSWYDEPSGSSIKSFSDQDDYADSWEAESSEATFDTIENDFSFMLGLEDGRTRFEMGHQIQDMLVQCSFASRQC